MDTNLSLMKRFSKPSKGAGISKAWDQTSWSYIARAITYLDTFT
jgi:hypothetical protein